MDKPRTEQTYARRLGVLLWLVGMAGIVTTLLIPLSLPEDAGLPEWLIRVLGLFQSSILLALAVWAGVRLAPKVHLHAPAFEALARGHAPWHALRPQIRPGLAGGLLAGVGLAAVSFLTPDALAGAEELFGPPLATRVLYGGITEELLIRWGLMTFLLWGAWRLWGHDAAAPPARLVWSAIVASALAFGALHLPTAFALTEEVTAGVLFYIIGANSAFGLLFGYLYWKRGLEAAMLAHILAHLVLFLMALTPILS